MFKEVTKYVRLNFFLARSRSGENQPKLVQGDIVETPWVKQMMAGGMSRGAAISNKGKLWPIVNGKRQIPYVINSGMMHTACAMHGVLSVYRITAYRTEQEVISLI